jgi:hypothetical protein
MASFFVPGADDVRFAALPVIEICADGQKFVKICRRRKFTV